jgi:hypothetical protein
VQTRSKIEHRFGFRLIDEDEWGSDNDDHENMSESSSSKSEDQINAAESMQEE